MFRRAMLTTLVAALVGSLPAAVSLGDPVPAAPTLVADPTAEAWAAYEPGAWVRIETSFETDAGREHYQTQLLVLVERNEHEVLLWSQSRMDETEGPGRAELHDRRVPAAEAKAEWESGDPLPVVDTRRETLRVGARDIACTVRRWTTGASRIEHWSSSAMPGGFVRRVETDDAAGQAAGAGADEVRLVESVVQAFGSKPEAGFPWPPVWNVEERLVENPLYARWAAFKPGAWVRQTHSSKPSSGVELPPKTTTLVEVRPTRLVLRRSPAGAAGGAAELEEVPRREVARRTSDPEASAHMGYPMTRASGRETISIAGKTLDCRTETSTATSAQDGMVVRQTVWLHADVPGQVVKQETRVEQGGSTTTNTVLVEAWGLAPR